MLTEEELIKLYEKLNTKFKFLSQENFILEIQLNLLNYVLEGKPRLNKQEIIPEPKPTPEPLQLNNTPKYIKEKPKLATKIGSEKIKNKPQHIRDKKRLNKKEIIDYIKTKEHTMNDIRDHFKFSTKSTVYYWIAQAGLKLSDLPKKVKVPVTIIKVTTKTKEKPKETTSEDDEDWEDEEEFSEG